MSDYYKLKPKEQRENIEEEKVIVFTGATGDGKSSLINALWRMLTGKRGELVVESKETESTTQQTTGYMIEYNGRRYVLVDTPGLNDTNKKDDVHIIGIADYLNSYLDHINMVVVLHSSENPRITKVVLKVFSSYMTAFGDVGNRTAFFYTKLSEFWNQEHFTKVTK